MIDPKIREKAMKLYALAERGVGGEKDNAKRMLELFLAKHNIKIVEKGSVESNIYDRMKAGGKQTPPKPRATPTYTGGSYDDYYNKSYDSKHVDDELERIMKEYYLNRDRHYYQHHKQKKKKTSIQDIIVNSIIACSEFIEWIFPLVKFLFQLGIAYLIYRLIIEFFSK